MDLSRGVCRGCGADILWVTMPSGKSMPLDAKSKKVIIEKEHHGHGETRVLPELVNGYTPHWASCPKAAEFKK